jgi:hypothetical protein
MAPVLVIEPVRREDAGVYDVAVSNACAHAESMPATVKVIPCRANWNADGRLDSGDVFSFLEDFFRTPPDADFNADGETTSADFFEFLAAWFKGC